MPLAQGALAEDAGRDKSLLKPDEIYRLLLKSCGQPINFMGNINFIWFQQTLLSRNTLVPLAQGALAEDAGLFVAGRRFVDVGPTQSRISPSISPYTKIRFVWFRQTRVARAGRAGRGRGAVRG